MNFPVRRMLSACLFVIMGSGMPYAAADTFNDLIKAGNYSEAIGYAEKSIPHDARTVDIWLHLAAAHEKAGSPAERVLACYKEAQKVNPSDPRVLFALGNYYLGEKKYDEAIKLFQSSFLLKRSGAAAEKIALCAASLGQWDKAKDAAESAVALDSGVQECRPILVKLYLDEKHWSGAVEQLEVLVRNDGANVQYWKRLADCYEKAALQSRIPRADSVIVALDKADTRSRLRFAQYSLAKQDTAAALRLYKELAILTPNDATPFKSLYALSSARGSAEDATLYLKNYLLLDSGNALLYWELGDLLYRSNDQDGAIESYRRAFRRAPQGGKGHFRRYADIVLRKKLEKEASTVITAAISAGEADGTLYTALGDLNRKQGQYAGAAKAYQEALKGDPKNVQVLSALAGCQAKSGDVKNAILSYEQIVLMNPRASQEYKALGALRQKSGKRDDAMASYKKYLELAPNDFETAKTVGLYSYELKQWGEAVKYLGMVTNAALRDVSLLVALGLSAAQLKDCATAADALSKAWAAKPAPSVRSRILIPLAECHERNGNALKASEAYQAYASLPSMKDPEIAYRAAFLKENTDRAGAIKAYSENCKGYPKDYRNYLRLGVLYSADSSQLSKSAVMLGAASRLADTVRALWRAMATVQRKLRQESDELAAWNKLLKLDPQDVEGNKRAGTILARRKQYGQAIAPLEVAAAAESQDFDLLRLLASCYLETKRPKEALTVLRKAKALRPEDPAVRVAIISAGVSIGSDDGIDNERDELAEIDKKVIAKDQKNIESRIRLIEYYYGKNAFTEALPLLKELTALTPRDPVVYRKLYEISTRSGNKQEGSEYLRKYLSLDPGNANAYRSLGDLLYEQKDFDGALAAYRTTVKLKPDIKGFYKNYIDIVLRKKLDHEAIPVIQNAIKCSEADLAAYLALGELYRKKNDCAGAIKMYQEALRLDPKDVAVMTSLAECQASTGDVKNAIVSFEQIVLMKPNPAKEYKTLGGLHLKTGKTESAMQAYRKYLAETPGDQPVARTVGLHAYSQKRYNDAVGYLELVKEPPLQTVEYLLALGECYHALRQPQRVIDLFSRVRSAKPSPAVLERVLKTLAECYDKSGDQAKALDAYDAYTKLPGVRDQEASYLSAYFREKSDPAGAIGVYAANTKLFPREYRNFLRLGLLLASDSSAYERSIGTLKAAAAIVDTIPLLWETLARVQGRLRSDDGELQSLQKLLVLQPQNIDANRRASTLLLKKKQIAQAITNLEMVLTMSPKDVQTMLLLAQGYLETKRAARAIELLEKAKSIDDKTIDIRAKLHELYRQGGQDQKAESEIRELIELTKNNTYRILYAKDLVAKQRYDEASKLVAEVKASDPMNVEGLMLRGAIQKAQKQYAEAIETYKEILYINDKYVPALSARGDAYLLDAKYERAEQYFRKALVADPKYALAELGLAMLAKAQKNTAGYQEHLAKAKALDPKHPLIRDEAAKAGVK